ncbi:Phosphoglycerate kinase 3, cytosolic, variant 2 [Salvia divinorum]|uniref:Phosphoglycerate kinase n=1 Tax=Salvia divinorum TaxID=28513 RepID=A0ABD1HV63_SALDI
MATKKSVGTLKEADLKSKKVLVRADLNVPLDDNFNITDDTRIRVAAVTTIKYLMGYGPSKRCHTNIQFKPLVLRLSELLGLRVMMANDCI